MWVNISDNYEASTDGHIRNAKTKRILKEFIGKDGYLRTQFGGKTRTVHRVIASAFVSSVVGKDFVNHKDGNKRNNRVDNLEWCTRSENMKHAYDHGLKNSDGVKNGRCKLTESDVLFVRDNFRRGDKACGCAALAKRFGVVRQTISAVVNGQNWRVGFMGWARGLPYANELIFE